MKASLALCMRLLSLSALVLGVTAANETAALRGSTTTARTGATTTSHHDDYRHLQDLVFSVNAGVDDAAYLTGSVWSSSFDDAIDVTGVVGYPQKRFKTHRSGNSGFLYTIPNMVPGQRYEIILGFAENWGGACALGSRVFSVTCNGQTLVSALDVVATTGSCYKAMIVSKVVAANVSGSLVIRFTSARLNPMVSFVDVKTSNLPPAPTAPPVPVPVGTSVFRVIAGRQDEAYLMPGPVWTHSVADAIDVTGVDYPAAWFQTHRSGASGFSYMIPGLVAGAYYEVSIGFAENYVFACAPGSRVISVACNGRPFVSSLDVFVKAGGCLKAVVLSRVFQADANGNMVVTFTSSAENPMLSVLELKTSNALAPTLAPTVAPTKAPVTTAPTTVPAPTTPKSCKVPKFVGKWEVNIKYPIIVAESQGATIFDDFVVFSGFTKGFGQATPKVYALKTGVPTANWRAMDDIPIRQGVTHAAFVVVGSQFFMCGGYLGGHPGPHIRDCVVYDHSIAPGDTVAGGQWSTFTPLPQGRAGGGMVYDKTSNSLIFTAGAERPGAVFRNPDAFDKPHTWALSLSNINGPWVAKADIPYLTNHQSYVTAIDGNGKQRHFFFGGQFGENEHTGNHNEMFEYQPATDAWIARKSMPFSRGHASSSTRAISCGFIVAAGSTNEFGRTADVSYYDIPTDTWTSIGSLPIALNTPVCDFGTDGYLYCESGMPSSSFSYKRRIALV